VMVVGELSTYWNVKSNKLQHQIPRKGAYLWFSLVRPVNRMSVSLKAAGGQIGERWRNVSAPDWLSSTLRS
jgi:hypothetical protein